jgi:hypothetical protein
VTALFRQSKYSMYLLKSFDSSSRYTASSFGEEKSDT